MDEHGSSIVSYGKMDNGTDQEVNGDTVFDIASITKPFTGLLLQDMIERGVARLHAVRQVAPGAGKLLRAEVEGRRPQRAWHVTPQVGAQGRETKAAVLVFHE